MNAKHDQPTTRAQRKRALDAIGMAIRCTRRQIWFYGTLSALLFATAFALFL